MTKKLPRIDAFRLHVLPETAPAYCNDNRPRRRLAAAAKPAAGRQLLTSHWRECGGRLEYHWQIGPADESSAEVPGLGWTKNKRRRCVDGRLGFAGLRKPAIGFAVA
jgi:hypothetical protein